MKNKSALRGAAVACAAMLAAGIGTGNVREAMASVEIPASAAITASVSGNAVTPSAKASVSGNRVTPSVTAAVRKDAETPSVTAGAKKDTAAGEKDTAKTSEGSTDAEIKEESENNSAEAVKENASAKAEETVPVPKAVEESDQTKEPEKKLASTREEQKREGYADTKEAESDGTLTEEATGTPAPSETTAPEEVVKDTESAANTEAKDDADEAPAQRPVRHMAVRKIVKASSGTPKEKTGTSENYAVTVNPEKTEERDQAAFLSASLKKNDPLPEQQTDIEDDAVLVGNAEKAEAPQAVELAGGTVQNTGTSTGRQTGGSSGGVSLNAGTSSGATQIVGDTTKRYETENPSSGGAAVVQQNNSGNDNNRGDLLAPKASVRVSGDNSSGKTSDSGKDEDKEGSSVSGKSTERSAAKVSGRRIRTSTPQTGDHAGMILYAVMAGASLAAAIAAVLMMKKIRD